MNNQPIHITRSQVGLTFERIDSKNGKWERQYECWLDLPLTQQSREYLDVQREWREKRADYRDFSYAWRGLATNVVTSISLDELHDIHVVLGIPPSGVAVVAVGSPFDGVTLYGPFISHDEAVEYGEGFDDVWNAVTLTPPV